MFCSVIFLNMCVRRLVKAARCSLEEALDCATRKPARLLGIDDYKGVLSPGAIADLIIIDENVNVKATYLSANLVYSHGSN
ncbi:hypothetical protein AB6A40_010824 [Gnathostoma spinigerum]|uniref:Amidohydrolase-related domain-containing protein n=1 Tax=Gnathostoma spinigerum TaxID=75299 RepID=A0ABD6EXD4_9BILA